MDMVSLESYSRVRGAVIRHGTMPQNINHYGRHKGSPLVGDAGKY